MLTSSYAGSISAQECFCEDPLIDIDPAESFNCVAATSLATFSASLTSENKTFDTFQGSLQVNVPLSELQQALASRLELPNLRASLQLDSDSDAVRFKVMGSEPELLAEMRAAFEAAPFKYWAQEVLGGGGVTSLANLTQELISCPQGAGFSGTSNCNCSHGMQPSANVAEGCQACPWALTSLRLEASAAPLAVRLLRPGNWEPCHHLLACAARGL